jgi:heptosyltransferase I
VRDYLRRNRIMNRNWLLKPMASHRPLETQASGPGQAFAVAPKRVCLLRLSAIGDTCHVVPLLHRLRRAWPDAQFTWVIGRIEAPLMASLPGVRFIIVDKRAQGEERRALLATLQAERFDLLLHLQVALRASRLAWRMHAPVKLGFDRKRARDAQWLFTTHRIPARAREHVLDSFLGFADALGVPECEPDFSLPLPAAARRYAEDLIRTGHRTLLVSPCSSHPLRDWHSERYAEVILRAQRDLGLHVILCGGPASREREMGIAIEHDLARIGAQPVINQIGKDTLPEMQALLERATVVLTPDSGPAHMGTLANVPVIGLYAATNPARSGPYRSLQSCVDRYDQAARRFCGRPAAELPWTRKIEHPGVMDLIEVGDVMEKLQALDAAGRLRSVA